MKKCYLYYSFISSVVFATACLVFSCVYGNIQGGIWAGAAALVASIYFNLNKLYFSNVLQCYCRTSTMDIFNAIGFVISLVSSAFGVWYLFTMFYWKTPIFDYERTSLFPCVFSFICGKWGLHLYTASQEYKEFLCSNYSPLV